MPLSFLIACNGAPIVGETQQEQEIINSAGTTLETRFRVPEGFERIKADSTSYTHYLRNLSMKPHGSHVLLYTGDEKSWQHVHAAVVDMEIGKKDLQQCADACIRLRAEYLFEQKRFDEIHFDLTNGFRMDYKKWMEGNRLKVEGNKTSWVKTAGPDKSYSSFRAYLDIVFMYAGTLSVEKEIEPHTIEEITPGDVIVVGGSPGHAVTVADVAVNKKGEKIFLLAQGYMPAQEIHIIKNPNDTELSPWFSNQFTGALETLEWRFSDFTIGNF